MDLSNELISQFAKVVNDDKVDKKETTLRGTTVVVGEETYVKLDGSDILTPVTTTTDVKDEERVTVMIKDHTATITGNTSSPAARTDDVAEIGNQISEFEIVIADKVSTKQLEVQIGRIDDLVTENVTIKERLTAGEASIDDLEADNVTINEKLVANDASIKTLEAEKIDAEFLVGKYATVENLEATNADIHNLQVDYGEFEQLATNNFSAVNADIDNLQATKLSAEDADLKYADIGSLDAVEADINILQADHGAFKTATAENLAAIDANIDNLEATKLSAEDANLKYANIDFANIGTAAIETFFTKSGMISDLVVGEGTITGRLVGVTIIGDLIEGGTVKADKLVVLGSDGLYYKLNTDGVTTSTEQTEYNSLNGSIITAQSITADKVNVTDLVAFGATIGGFKITDDSIYSGVKESVDNTTTGIYLDKEGQVAFGDGTNFVKYYKDQNGDYKLEISAGSVSISSSSKNLEEELNDIKSDVDTLRDEITTLLRIESSRGTVFKNDQVATVLSVVIYHGTQRITDYETMIATFGSGAYLQWKWLRLDDETFGIISSSDSRFGDNGFTFTLSPEDVDTKVTFMCELIV